MTWNDTYETTLEQYERERKKLLKQEVFKLVNQIESEDLADKLKEFISALLEENALVESNKQKYIDLVLDLRDVYTENMVLKGLKA